MSFKTAMSFSGWFSSVSHNSSDTNVSSFAYNSSKERTLNTVSSEVPETLARNASVPHYAKGAESKSCIMKTCLWKRLPNFESRGKKSYFGRTNGTHWHQRARQEVTPRRIETSKEINWSKDTYSGGKREKSWRITLKRTQSLIEREDTGQLIQISFAETRRVVMEEEDLPLGEKP